MSMPEEALRYRWGGGDFHVVETSMGDDEYDAACILQLPERVYTAHADEGDVEFEYADENPAAWAILTKRYPPERIEALRRLAQPEAAELARIFVPPYERMRDGHLQEVRGYWREVPDARVLSPSGVLGERPKVTTDWDPVVEEIRAQGLGNCYEAAGTLMMNRERLGLRNPRYIQAAVTGTGGAVLGIQFCHTWVEADGETIVKDGKPQGTLRYAIDFASGNATIMPVAMYRALGDVQMVHEYTTDELIERLLETRVWGPFSEDLITLEEKRSGQKWRGKKRPK